VAYSDQVFIPEFNKNTIKKNKTLIDASKEVDVEIKRDTS
jgi:hypothetical protein